MTTAAWQTCAPPPRSHGTERSLKRVTGPSEPTEASSLTNLIVSVSIAAVRRQISFRRLPTANKVKSVCEKDELCETTHTHTHTNQVTSSCAHQ